jgi:hypothetical protein
MFGGVRRILWNVGILLSDETTWHHGRRYSSQISQLLFWKINAVYCNNDTEHARKLWTICCVFARQIGRCSRLKNNKLHRSHKTSYISKHSVVFLVLPQSLITALLLLNRNNSFVKINITIIWAWEFIWNWSESCPMFDRVQSLKLMFIVILVIIIIITSFL